MIKKIDAEKIGQKIEGLSPTFNFSFDGYIASKQLADKINELIDYINHKEIEGKLGFGECVTCGAHNYQCGCKLEIEGNQNWQIRFEKEFLPRVRKNFTDIFGYQNATNEFRDFISKELQSCKEQTKKEIIEIIIKKWSGAGEIPNRYISELIDLIKK